MDSYKDVIIEFLELEIPSLKNDYDQTEDFIERVRSMISFLTHEVDGLEEKYWDKVL